MAGALLLTSAPAQALPEFRQQTIDTGTRHLPTVVNDHGWVAGPHMVHSGYYWDAFGIVSSSQFMPLGMDPIIYGFDSLGNYAAYDPSNQYRGVYGSVYSTPSTFNACGPASLPMGLSETGFAVGYGPCNSNATAFIWDTLTDQSVPILGLNSPDSALNDISPEGQYAVGWGGQLQSQHGEPPNYYSIGFHGKYFYGEGSATTAFRYDLDSQLLEPLSSAIIGVPGGASVVSTTALGTNDDGAVVGYVTFQSGQHNDELPVLWPNPSVGYVLPTAGVINQADGCRANAINGDWQVVGSCFRASNGMPTEEAFIWDPARGTRVLSDVTPGSNDTYYEATDINERGQITVGLHVPNFVDPGAALLSPLSMSWGSCVSGASCEMMHENQCQGHSGSFAANLDCSMRAVEYQSQLEHAPKWP